MKKLFYSLAALFALTVVGCVKEDDAGKEPPLVYIDVPVSVGENDGSPDTKSLVSVEAEEFQKAALFAFKASDHKILPSQTGVPLTLTTEEKTFSWSLPSNVEMNIYVLCNYGDMDLSNYLSNANLTESDLQALKFTCASGTELQNLAKKGYGLPMAGVAENQVVNAQNNSLSLKVKKLFSRYDIYFDKSAFENKGYTINALYISASKSNTEVPYFVEGFQQTELSKLSLVDLGTPADIENLNQGDKNHAVTLYFLENCQGTKSGASKWYDVAGTNMPGKNLCSYIDIGIKATDALGNDANFFYWVYLGSGSGACVTDFNVRRNEKHTLKLTLQTPDVYAPTFGIKFVETDNELKYRKTASNVYSGSGSINYYHWVYFSLPFQTNIPEGEVTYSIGASYTKNVTVGSYLSNTTDLTKYSYASNLNLNLGAYVDDVNKPITVRVGKKEGDSWVVFDECKILLSYSTPVITYSIDIVGDETATVGETVNLKAMFYTLTNGFPNSGEDVTNSATWSKVSGVGSVSSTGAVTSSTAGKCTVKVSYDGMGDMVTDTHSVTFTGPTDVITYSLEITGASTATVGSSVNLKAIYHTITNGEPDAGTDVTSLASWSIASGVGSVFGGTVTSSAEGTANVKATYSGETATHSVEFTGGGGGVDVVTWRMKSLSITPSTIQVGGSTTSYSAIKEKYVNGEASGVTADADVTGWSSSNTSIATVSGGTVTGVAVGSATITATDDSCESGYQTADATVTVSAVPVTITWRMKSLSITPSTIQVGGSTTSYSAIKEKYVDGVASGETADADVTGWSSSSTSIATVSGGTVTGVAAGTATITATDSSCETGYTTADASVTVTTAPPSDDFEWIDTSISMDTDGSSVTASFKSSGYPSFTKTEGIDLESPSYDSGSKTGSVKISISNPSSFSDGDNSASVTGSCGTASDVLDITVHKPVFTYHKKVITTLSSSTIQWSEYSYASATLYTTTYRDGVNKGTTTENVTSSGFVAYSGIHVIFEDGYKIRAGSNTESSIGSVNIKSDYPGADEYEDAVLTIEKKQYYIPITVSEDGSGGYEIVVDEYNNGYGAALPCSVTLTFEFTDGVKPTVTLSAGQKYETFTPLGSGHGNLESVTLDPSSYDDHCEHYTFSVSVE